MTRFKYFKSLFVLRGFKELSRFFIMINRISQKAKSERQSA